MKAKQLLVALVLLTAAVSVQAQTQRSGDTNARAMQQLQQLSSERTQLKAENDKLKQEVDDLKKQFASGTAGLATLQQRLKIAESAATRDAASGQQNTEALEKARAQLQELVGRYRETAQTLKDVESDRNSLRNVSQMRERDLNVCIERNAGLYDVNAEILDRYEKKGVWSTLTEKEPFTKIQRARLENLVDGYKERAAELRLDSSKPK